MASITKESSTATTTSSNFRFRVTRVGVFSLVFIIGGIILLVGSSNIDPAVFTTLTFGEGIPNLVIPTYTYVIIVAGSYIASGIFGLLPLPERMNRFKSLFLLINGILIIPTILIVVAAGTSANMTQTLSSSFRLATPIAIGALAGIWCERSGVVNIAIEGMMLTGAAIGFIAMTFFVPTLDTGGAQLVGVLIAALAGGLMALLHAWLSITFRTDQIVSGTVINILAVGITSFLRREVLLSSEASRETLSVIHVPFLSDIPIIGEILFTGKPIYLSMFILIIITHVVIYFTRWGLRTRAVGENPHAADTLGINVFRNRYINVVIGGLIAGFAGAWFSLETVGNFDDNMTGGLGFIALAAMIFGKWTPFGAFAGALLFGFSQALNARFQILEVPVPPQFVQMIPYIVTMVVLAGLVGRANPPAADGVPYTKE